MVAAPQAQPAHKPVKLNKRRAGEMRDEFEALYQDSLRFMQLRLPKFIERMAFYRGLQFGVATEFGWVPDGYDSDEAREVYNYVRPTVRVAVAKKLKNMPNPQTVPSGSGQRAMARALASQQLLRSFLRNGVISYQELYRAGLGGEVYGASWLKTFWNPNKGRFRDVPIARPSALDPTVEEEQLDEFGEPLMDLEREGEIDLEYVDVVDALPDPHAKTPGQLRHIFHRKLLPLSTLNDQFPEDYEGRSTEGRWSSFGRDHAGRERDFVEQDTRVFGGTFGGNALAADLNGLAEIVEAWELPSNTYPRGRLCVFSPGGAIVAVGPLPHDWPWTLLPGENMIPSSLYSDGIVQDTIPVQRTINFVASKKREWVDKAGQAWLMLPKGSVTDRSKFSDMSGEIIEYNQLGGRPEWQAPPPIPQGFFTMESNCVDILKDVSMHSDISRGEHPTGIETGRALAYLYEFQQGATEPDANLFKEAMTQVLRQCLSLARDFYDEGRIVHQLGANNRWLAQSFRRQDYDFDAESTIEPYSGAPNSRALRFAEAVELFEKGAFEDTPAAEKLRTILSYDSEGSSTVDDEEVARNQARAENLALLEDPFSELVVREQEDHAMHAVEHDRFRNSEEYDDLPWFAQKTIDDHAAWHQEWADFQYQASMMLEAGGQAPAPPSGPPSDGESPADGGFSAYPDGSPDERGAQPSPPSTAEAGLQASASNRAAQGGASRA